MTTTPGEPITEFGEFVNPKTEEESKLVTCTLQLPLIIVDKLTRLGATKGESINQYAAAVLIKHCTENIGQPVINGPSYISGSTGQKITGPSKAFFGK